MLFLLEYKRSEGRLVTFKTFDDSEHSIAAQTRLEIELDLHRRGISHEVVILDAASESALRRTHRRYFETIDEIVKSNGFDTH